MVASAPIRVLMILDDDLEGYLEEGEGEVLAGSDFGGDLVCAKGAISACEVVYNSGGGRGLHYQLKKDIEARRVFIPYG